MNHVVRAVWIAGILLFLGGSIHAQGPPKRKAVMKLAFFAAAARDFTATSGSAIEVRGGPPWFTADVAPSEGGRLLRRFGDFLYVINTAGGSISQLRWNGNQQQTIDLGAGSEPQDILVKASRIAYITRSDDPRLFRFDLATEIGNDIVDLGVLAEADETPSLRTLHSDGNHLFVQVQLVGSLGQSRGVLGVVDTTTDLLLDLDPMESGVQGISLAGAPPRLKMQILGRTLFVSTTGNRMDNRGGIEMVDLDSLSSTGFALTEEQLGSIDIGGFVMISLDEGYVMGHTDIVKSTHLRHFTISGGPTPGPDLLTLLGDAVESLAYDARRNLLYPPRGFANYGAARGVHVLDTTTNRLLDSGLIETHDRVHDVVLAR